VVSTTPVQSTRVPTQEHAADAPTVVHASRLDTTREAREKVSGTRRKGGDHGKRAHTQHTNHNTHTQQPHAERAHTGAVPRASWRFHTHHGQAGRRRLRGQRRASSKVQGQGAPDSWQQFWRKKMLFAFFSFWFFFLLYDLNRCTVCTHGWPP
jgi:hypothetical protein